MKENKEAFKNGLGTNEDVEVQGAWVRMFPKIEGKKTNCAGSGKTHASLSVFLLK